MDKQLLIILKKRYGFFLILCILFIFLYYSYTSIQGLAEWKNSEQFYDSAKFKTSIDKNNIEDYAFAFEETEKNFAPKTVEEIQEKLKLNNLQIFHRYMYQDILENEILAYSSRYFSLFNNVESILLILFICLLGFSLFFFDLKTSFNEFLFSSSISKKKIYCYKYLFLALPLLLAILFSKLAALLIIIGTIPKQYIALNLSALISYIIFSWLLLVFYFILASLIGLVCGHTLLGGITVCGLTLSIPSFCDAFNNSFIYLGKESTLFENPFYHQLTDDTISPLKYMSVIIICCLFVGIGYWLFPKIALDKKGDYLLVDQFKLLTLLLMSIYIPILYVFPTVPSVDMKITLLRYIICLILTLIVGFSIIYHKQLMYWWHEKKLKTI